MKIRLALCGAALFAVPQICLLMRGGKAAWFLDSLAAMAVVLSTLAIGALLVGVFQWAKVMTIVQAMSLGAALALAMTLIIIGAGNMWPLVVVQGAALCAAAIFVGAVLGTGIRVSYAKTNR